MLLGFTCKIYSGPSVSYLTILLEIWELESALLFSCLSLILTFCDFPLIYPFNWFQSLSLVRSAEKQLQFQTENLVCSV